MRRFSAFFIVYFFLIPISNISSQEVDDRGDFFSNDFANSSEVTGLDEKKDDEDLFPDAHTRDEPAHNDLNHSVPSVSREIEVVDRPAIAREQSGNSISQVELYVNGFDKQHLERIIQAALRFKSQRKLPLTLNVIGPEDVIEKGSEKRLIDAKIKILHTTSIPADLPSQESPLWILQTGNGPVALEGIVSPSAFVNQRAAFIRPEIEDGYEILKVPQDSNDQ